ncbi:MAG: methyl-accepting chemotaxis protein [Planctomycetota bacterium]
MTQATLISPKSAATSSDHPIEKSQAAATAEPTDARDISVTSMVGELSTALESAINEIHAVNSETKVLALNARIEAARAGTHGAAFGVVAEEMQTLSDKTSTIANDMAYRTREKTSELMELIDTTVRGTRLSDIALVNIDLIDRNLYERTCDVRWWATDGSLVDALSEPSESSHTFASKRLGVILDAYTVYHDLVLCDRSGEVIANGRPDRFASVGRNESRSAWYTSASSTASGDEYGFQSAHVSSLVNDQPSLVYSCSVRQNGDTHGKPLGVLGIVFNWLGLAQPILDQMPIRPSEKSSTKAFIIDRQNRILVSDQNSAINCKLEMDQLQQIWSCEKGFFVTEFDGTRMCVGHAMAPGFETYSTGWASIVMQPVGA